MTQPYRFSILSRSPRSVLLSRRAGGKGFDRRRRNIRRKTEGPRRAPRKLRVQRVLRLERLEVHGGLLAVAAGLEVVADLLPLIEGVEAAALDGGDVDERVLAT